MSGHNSIRYIVRHLQTKKLSRNNHRRCCCHTHVKLVPASSRDRNNGVSAFNLMPGNEDPRRGKRGQQMHELKFKAIVHLLHAWKDNIVSHSIKLTAKLCMFFFVMKSAMSIGRKEHAWKDNCFVRVVYGGRCPNITCTWIANADKCSSTALVSPQATKLNNKIIPPIYGRCMIKAYIGCMERHEGNR